MDGHRDEVTNPDDDLLDVKLFVRETPEERLRCAYRWAGRSTNNGKHWVLVFDCIVSRWVYETPAPNPNANIYRPA